MVSGVGSTKEENAPPNGTGGISIFQKNHRKYATLEKFKVLPNIDSIKINEGKKNIETQKYPNIVIYLFICLFGKRYMFVIINRMKTIGMVVVNMQPRLSYSRTERDTFC